MKNVQTKLADADLLRMTTMQLKQQLIEKDKAILALEQRLMSAYLKETYGNDGEYVSVSDDGTITRTPTEPTTP